MSESLADLQAMLDAVNAAILAILAGAQSYTIAGRQWQRAQLGELRVLRNELRDQVARAESSASGRPRVRHLQFKG